MKRLYILASLSLMFSASSIAGGFPQRKSLPLLSQCGLELSYRGKDAEHEFPGP